MKKVFKFLLVSILFFIGSLNAYASTKTFDRTTLDNYGVNKKWQITSKNKTNVLNSYKVDSEEKIYDFSNVLTSSEEQQLYEKIKKFVDNTQIDMVIVTVNLPYTRDKVNEDFAADFYDYNDFGIDFKNYSGILLLRNTYEKDPYFNIYTFGDAQLYFSYNRCENILDYIYSDLHAGNYYNGFSKFIDKTSKYYKSGIPFEMKNYGIDENGFLYKKYVVPYALIIIISSIVTLIVTLILVKKNKMVAKATTAMEYLDKESINYTFKNDVFITSHTSSYVVSSSSGGGGSHSHSGSSGGGHSSGGGRHG